MTRIIADVKNKSDAYIIYHVIKKFNAKVKMMGERQWEDYVLGKMASEAETEGEIASREEVSKWFKQYGIDY